jgi:hypothetical protein
MIKELYELHPQQTSQKSCGFAPLTFMIAPSHRPTDTVAFRQKYKLSAGLYMEFTANTAELDNAAKMAKRTPVAKIYEDVLLALNEIRYETLNANGNNVLNICSELEKQILNK